MRIENFFVNHGDGYAFSQQFCVMLQPPMHFARLDLLEDWEAAMQNLHEDLSMRSDVLRRALGAYAAELKPEGSLQRAITEGDDWAKSLAVVMLLQVEKLCDVGDPLLIEQSLQVRSQLHPGEVLEEVMANAIAVLFEMSKEHMARQAAVFVVVRGSAQFRPRCVGAVDKYLKAIETRSIPSEAQGDPRFDYLRRQFDAENELLTDKGARIRGRVPLKRGPRTRWLLGGTPDEVAWGRAVWLAAGAAGSLAIVVLIIVSLSHRSQIDGFVTNWVAPIRDSLK